MARMHSPLRVPPGEKQGVRGTELSAAKGPLQKSGDGVRRQFTVGVKLRSSLLASSQPWGLWTPRDRDLRGHLRILPTRDYIKRYS